MAMEQSKEHIATLCAIGTIGIAATGLALGTSEGETFLIKPGKRKAPGEDARYPLRPSTVPTESRRAVSQPVTSSSTTESLLPRLSSTAFFRRKTIQDPELAHSGENSRTHSRGSSLSRHSILRPFTSGRDASSERKESRPASSWLKRMSNMSSTYNSSPASSISRFDMEDTKSKASTQHHEQPNKLVKRPPSNHALSFEHPKNLFRRRPATSRQRSELAVQVSDVPEVQESVILDERHDGCISTMPIWRPYFDTGYSRKRHTSGGTREPNIRTLSAVYGRSPTLLSGSFVQRGLHTDEQEDNEIRVFSSPPMLSTVTNTKQRSRRSLVPVSRSGRQRNFTEPIVRVSNSEAYGSILPVGRPSPLSPLSNISTFEVNFPQTTPNLVSNPPIPMQPEYTLHTSKRNSFSTSDQMTASSDNVTRGFSDDDSMDFHSDSAYDSSATRATASSHSGYHAPNIQTIFDEARIGNNTPDTKALAKLMQDSTLDDESKVRSPQPHTTNIGIGIQGLEHTSNEMDEIETTQSLTPPRRIKMDEDELNLTPMAFGYCNSLAPLTSSPPPLGIQNHTPSPLLDERNDFPEQMDLDNDDFIDWSPKSEQETKDPSFTEPLTTSLRWDVDESSITTQDHGSNNRLSIFDWSETHRLSGELTNGVHIRPKTVHGKQGNDNSRSRPTGRKAPSAVHLRSQSVPVNRDSLTDTEGPSSASKFGTWGLGNKPVSEEWSDDFEFEDEDEDGDGDTETMSGFELPVNTDHRGSFRSVKVPQSIIDRQASVHLQFGQVQEFMLLVEELKRLRTRGSALQLLDSHSKQLWEDAENIINLATLNDEDDGPLRPASPTSSDIFGEETPPTNKNVKDISMRSEDSKRNSINRRSASNPATPPSVRPRGESLAQAKSFLQTIHHSRSGNESSPVEPPTQPSRKLPFDTQDLRDLVIRAGIITRALKEIVRKAEGVSISPQRTPQRTQDPSYCNIFNPPDSSPCPPFKPGLPKSRSANSYLGSAVGSNNDKDIPSSLKFPAVIEAN